ncbi:uncharacterized F-box/LRR-repeat protein C02F5.7 isoform X2 [Tetranychus urticae]|uniref:uncharacterized F-box/LRR-repeat protein C02F5.7 isoform X2 n=1 Tax=Tetranychus urticae TaxID=32264 RepID=UPI00077B8DB0|nr:uncharacterized F-box/LRR-repeat protein C02F5.7 isoform X2 [Tetranychus urticae]
MSDPVAESEPSTSTQQKDAKEEKDGKEETKVKTIYDVDVDPMIIIFGKLDVRNRTRCERVCRLWNEIVMQCWQSTQLLAFENSFNIWRDESGQILDTLTLTKILSKCPNVKTINLEQTATNFDETIFNVIGQHCPHLQKLIMKHKNLSRYNIANLGRACPSIKSIDFSNCNNISERSLQELLELRPDLESISLSQVDNITGRCFDLCTNLSYLDLLGCSSIVTDAFSRLGQNCSQTLKTLLAPSLTQAGYEIICNTFRSLEVLQVQSSHGGTLSGARLLGNLTKLRVLRILPYLKDLDNDTFVANIKKWPDLTELCIFGAQQLKSLSVSYLPKYCPLLTDLTLERSKIDDESARALATLKKLKELKINGSSITDVGAMHLLAHCPTLELLSLNQCYGISLETVLYGWDLVHQGLASKELVIIYNLTRIRPSAYATREDCSRYEEGDMWASDDEVCYIRSANEGTEESREEHEEYEDHQFVGNYDYIVDGDLESEEELT